jgi:ribosomal protein S18 acetylase RimI-like enzyme
MINTTPEEQHDRRIRRLIGAYLVVSGLVDFFTAANQSATTQSPQRAWWVLFGMPILGIGVWIMDASWFTSKVTPALEIRQVAYDDPDAAELTVEVQGEYLTRYGGPDQSPVDPATFLPPDGAFFVGYLDGRPVAMGGWRIRSDVEALDGTRLAELKRMYVRSENRRRGLARQVLAHLELTAKVAGVDVMILETGNEQPEAVGLYIREGYGSIAPFGHYADSPKSLSFGKRL